MIGRYLAAKSEADHYNRELQREQEEIDTVPDVGKPPPAGELRTISRQCAMTMVP